MGFQPFNDCLNRPWLAPSIAVVTGAGWWTAREVSGNQKVFQVRDDAWT